MKAAISIHDVTAIRVKSRQPSSGETHWRDVEIETADGEVLVVTTFTDGESAEIETADVPTAVEAVNGREA